MRILETALYVDDLAAAETFYGNVLGLKQIARAEGRHVFFRVGEGVLLVFDPRATRKRPGNLQLPVPPHGSAGAGHVCFAASATDVDAWEERLQKFGVEIEADFQWPNGGRSIYFRDPAGNSLEFTEPRIWGLE